MLMLPALIVKNRLVMFAVYRYAVHIVNQKRRKRQRPGGHFIERAGCQRGAGIEYRYEDTPSVLSKLGSVLNPATPRAIVLLKPPIWTTGAALRGRG